MKKTKTIEELTKKGYYYVNSNINNTNFPIPETVETENYTILKFEKSFSSQEAIDKIKAEGLRPATIHELALLKQNHPELWPKGIWSALIAFGSIRKDAGGSLGVPFVFADTDGVFWLFIGDWGGDWGAGSCLVCFCDNQPLETQALKEELSSLDTSALTDEIAIAHLKANSYKITKEIITVKEF